jgi:tRNA pseudouridine13 synthase
MDLSFLSKTPGIGGSIKNKAEDFLVEEILNDGIILELNSENWKPETENHLDKPSKFIHFILQKRDWSTSYAIREIAKKLHTSAKRFNYAGLKDKRAITTQLISATGMDIDKIRLLNIKDIQINGAWHAKDKVRLGQLLGNRFSIRIRDAIENSDEVVQQIYQELGGLFPNYFGEQRFGTISQNTHKIGEKIIRGNFEEAAMEFLCNYETENNAESRTARQELAKTQDFRAALKDFPHHLRFERTMIAHLADNSGDFIGAFKKLPRHTLLLFIHAFQSFIFNQLLSDRLSEGKVEMHANEDRSRISKSMANLEMEEGEYLCPVSSFGFPDLQSMDVEGFLCIKLLGYNSNPNEREKDILEKHGITKEQFRIKEIPEISSKGTFRTAFAPLKDFSFKDNTFRFSLQSGSYATSALREFLEIKKH